MHIWIEKKLKFEWKANLQGILNASSALKSRRSFISQTDEQQSFEEIEPRRLNYDPTNEALEKSILKYGKLEMSLNYLEYNSSLRLWLVLYEGWLLVIQITKILNFGILTWVVLLRELSFYKFIIDFRGLFITI